MWALFYRYICHYPLPLPPISIRVLIMHLEHLLRRISSSFAANLRTWNQLEMSTVMFILYLKSSNHNHLYSSLLSPSCWYKERPGLMRIGSFTDHQFLRRLVLVFNPTFFRCKVLGIVIKKWDCTWIPQNQRFEPRLVECRYYITNLKRSIVVSIIF